VRVGFEAPHEVSVHRHKVRKGIGAEVSARRTPIVCWGLEGSAVW
jgi:sRNA-binding carbon storage regulator CsrA